MEILSLLNQKFDEIASFLAMTDCNEKRENGMLINPERFVLKEKIALCFAINYFCNHKK
jgi:hypothetical protein